MKAIPPSLLQEAVERLKAEFQPEAIYLFGSHAWGAPTEDSDVFRLVQSLQGQRATVGVMTNRETPLGRAGAKLKQELIPLMKNGRRTHLNNDNFDFRYLFDFDRVHHEEIHEKVGSIIFGNQILFE